MVLRRVRVMNGSSSKGCENLCARHRRTSRRQSLEAALSPNRGESTSPAVKHWRRKTVRRRRSRSSNSSHLIYIQSENRCHSYRGILHLTWHSNFSLCLCHLSKGTRSRELPSWLGECHCWVCHSHTTNASKERDINRGHTWEFSQNVTKLICYCLQN